jgi:chorismate-pyruvate lyase
MISEDQETRRALIAKLVPELQTTGEEETITQTDTLLSRRSKDLRGNKQDKG